MESPAGSKTESERDKTCPFLLRTFVKVNSFHSLQLFEENRLPVEDEHQIYTWKDATLREVVTYLRSLPPTALSLSLRHPSARYAFRVVFPDVTSRGKMTTKDLGTVWAKDVIDVSSLTSKDDVDSAGANTMEIDQSTEPPPAKNGDLTRTLEELRVVPGDWLLVAVHLPQKAMGMSIAGAAGTASGPSSNPKRVAGEEVVEQIQRSAPIGEEEEEELRQRQELGVEHTAGMLIVHGTAGHHPQDETETEDHHPQVGRETERGTGREIATAQEVGLGLALEVGLVLHRGGPNVIDGLIMVNVQM
ncbi:hypothetical protein FRC04_000056 [Tulasnella sp. 424]|nr:hypothetical protein FRC04_000056 [Tulasnella sp. 424]KAG8981918.1 hypothetical protein FRC05_000060 [Tulasnella sp. 425]